MMKSAPGTVIRRQGFAGERHVVLPADAVEGFAGDPVLRDLYPTAVGHFPHAEGHLVVRPKGTADFILILCVDGSGWCRFGGRHWRLHAEQAVVVPRGVAHSYGTTKRRPWSIYWAHLAGMRVMDYMRFMDLTAADPLATCGNVGELSYHFEAALDRLKYGYSPANLLAMSASLRQILALMHLHRKADRAAARPSMEKARATVDFMRQNLSRPMTIADFARFAGLSVPHYSALFRRAFGHSPVAYFLRLKAQEASQLLVTTASPVGEIARSLGIDDPYYFSRFFKKAMGLAPAHFRARHAAVFFPRPVPVRLASGVGA
jgi:AraC family transcriptional regulator, arabinose operon regulatory protein